ncbi:HPF/RaiA family ribosome-associated protein [uncultured Azohydromonas sp.]|jgi:Ribosome-associated protein Y (PSrp-1)|uniref:HPF/RaiA family ribosome-associated protein n=1 Tax=uncultured Azohydromonas sp. TaxID=487342 RepID=UPI002639ABA7|nr:HPF/RaiA family ribosome-associated protein [uncultured Azohydromonas sp.]
MQVQVNHDDHIPGREDMERQIAQMLEAELDRYADQITRVEVHLSDNNADKLGDDDKRCLIEARVAGHGQLTASHQTGDMRAAIDGAIEKLLRVLDSSVGKVQDKTKNARETIRREGVDGL